MIEIKKDLNADTEKVYGMLTNLEGLTERGIRQGWFVLGKAIRDKAQKEILVKRTADATHKVYRVYGPKGKGRRHVASAPGEYHANRSGKLRGSIGFKVSGFHALWAGYGVSLKGAEPAPKHGKWMEFGTKKSAKHAGIAPRPSIQNAIEDSQASGDALIWEGIKRELET